MSQTTAIKEADLIESIAASLQYISYYHPTDYISHLASAYEREQAPAAKDAMAQILTNSYMTIFDWRAAFRCGPLRPTRRRRDDAGVLSFSLQPK